MLSHSQPAPLSPYKTDRDVEEGSSSHSSPAENNTNWDVSPAAAAAKNIHRRLKGRHSPTQSSSAACTPNSSDSDSDRLPLLLRSDSSSDSQFCEENAHPLSPTAPGGLAGSSHTMKSALRLLALSGCLTCFLYNLPGLFLEVAYFPARGRMMPGGLKSILFKPTFHFEAVQAAIATASATTDNNLEAATRSSNSNTPAAPTDQGGVNIPRIVHVTYKSREELPDEWKYSLQQWEKMNPNWEVRFWSDKDIVEFVHDQYPHMEQLHKSYKYMIQRVDSVRYMILHHFGGVYSDMDIYPATALDKLLQQWEQAGKNVLLSETFNLGVTNAFMAAAPQSNFMSCVIDNLPHYQHRFYHIIGWQHWEVLSSAGSTFLWGMVGHCQDDQVQILAARTFRGCSVCDAWETGKPPAPCDTEWFHHSSTNSSWHQHESLVHAFFFTLSMGLFCRPLRGCFLMVLLVLALIHRCRRHRRRSAKS